jgi:hypothetical protein
VAPALLQQDEGLRASLPAHRISGGLAVREAKPWYRKSNDPWYVEVCGKQVRLAKGKANRAEAVRQFHVLMAGLKPAGPATRSVAEVSDLFLQHSEREHSADTFCWDKRYLQSFCDRFGHLMATDLIPFHLTSWLDSHPTCVRGRSNPFSSAQ